MWIINSQKHKKTGGYHSLDFSHLFHRQAVVSPSFSSPRRPKRAVRAPHAAGSVPSVPSARSASAAFSRAAIVLRGRCPGDGDWDDGVILEDLWEYNGISQC